VCNVRAQRPARVIIAPRKGSDLQEHLQADPGLRRDLLAAQAGLLRVCCALYNII